MLVVAADIGRPLRPPVRVSLDQADELLIGRASGLGRAAVVRDRRAYLALDDGSVSRGHARIVRRPHAWELIDPGSTNGTIVNGALARAATLSDGDLIEIGDSLLVFRDEGGAPASTGDAPLGALTLNPEQERRFADLVRVASSAISVLVRGETGTGKELAARAVHRWSGRRGPFVAVNCGALPAPLVEAELFGYRRGAFSGAIEDRDGLIRRAHGGTLFLDEVGDLRPESQAALLRVLQDGEVRPIGSSDAVRVDVRVVAATHQDLVARLLDERFRHDLYARLAGHVVTLRPLRERREDIGLLTASILPRFCPAPETVRFRRSALRALFRYDYPLNVRELEQALRSAVVLAGEGLVGLEHLPEPIRELSSRSAARVPEVRAADRELRDRLVAALEQHDGNIAAVGRALGKAPAQIRRWCARMQIDLAPFRR